MNNKVPTSELLRTIKKKLDIAIRSRLEIEDEMINLMIELLDNGDELVMTEYSRFKRMGISERECLLNAFKIYVK